MRGISSLVLHFETSMAPLAAVRQVITRNTNTTVMPRESGYPAITEVNVYWIIRLRG